MIGKLRSTVIDCRDPRALATFYAGVLGGTPFQLSPEHEPPQFPDLRGSQQFHLDIAVDEVDAAEDNLFRVYRDPGGHTFCLVWGINDQQI